MDERALIQTQHNRTEKLNDQRKNSTKIRLHEREQEREL